MIAVYVPCSSCNGSCHIAVKVDTFWETRRCDRCDGLGRQWAPGAPSYGCKETLADRWPGDIVTLGNGQRVKIAWHQPRKDPRRPKIRPETTYLDHLIEFTEVETYIPIPYPSCIGVASVELARQAGEDHDGDRGPDYNDPMQRPAGGRLL